MKTWRRPLTIVAVMATLGAPAAGADVLLLRNGESLEGHFVGRDADVVRFDTEDGEIRVPRRDVSGLSIQVASMPLCLTMRGAIEEDCDRQLLRVEAEALVILEGEGVARRERRIPMRDVAGWRLSKTEWNQRASRSIERNTPVTVTLKDRSVSGVVQGADGMQLYILTASGERIAVPEREIVSVSMIAATPPASNTASAFTASGASAAEVPAQASGSSRSDAAASDVEQSPAGAVAQQQHVSGLDLVPVVGQWRRGRKTIAGLFAFGFATAGAGLAISYDQAQRARTAVERDPLFQLLGTSARLNDFERAQANQRAFGWGVLGLVGLHALDLSWNLQASPADGMSSRVGSGEVASVNVRLDMTPADNALQISFSWNF